MGTRLPSFDTTSNFSNAETIVPDQAHPRLGPQPDKPNIYSPTQSTLSITNLAPLTFTAQTPDGQVICTTQNSRSLLHQRLKFLNAHRSELFTIETVLMTNKNEFRGFSPGGYDFYITRARAITREGIQSTVSFRNASDGKRVELNIRTNWAGSLSHVTYAGSIVAEINPCFIPDTHTVTVAPNVDLSLMAALCICFCKWQGVPARNGASSGGFGMGYVSAAYGGGGFAGGDGGD
ncbi:hypothetical protein K470DRAFT_257201 [Piedraia hortae CBS 480.64]|uniref:Tubby C-terminal-like domain-containing protein n=1 Tax=Piedraia hortae CBS 480.64 TaxID=1314780 RepID=A0A6A7C0N6_9PEZI|nr:hypothetical protein K470DRAFT_257201 [Piedraia hortae CBS 480.64]